MDQLTPARTIKEKDLKANVEAFKELLSLAGRPIKVLDIRYGLGGWAKALSEKLPKVEIVGYEADKETADRAWKGGNVLLLNRLWQSTIDNGKQDLLLADFNIVTMKNRSLLDEAINAIRPKRIIFTDVACVKLHLNYKSYGLKNPSLDDYWRAFPLPGYIFVAYAKKHHAASTALFIQQKTPAKLAGASL